MQTLIKRHLIGLFALVLTVTTMSFKMMENTVTSFQWYYVEESGIIGGNSDGPDGLLCLANKITDLCQIRLNNNHPKPSTVGEAEDLELVEMYAGRP